MKKILIISILGLFLVSCSSTLATTQTHDTIIYDTIPPIKKGYIIVEVVDWGCMSELQPVKSKKECTSYFYRKENE